jgi:YVTN family beta-propeller protein
MKQPRTLLASTAAVLLTAGLTACSGGTDGSSGATQGTAAPPRSTAGGQRVDTGVTGTVWVANEQGDSISVLDARSAKVITTLTGVDQPHNVQAAMDAVYLVSGSGNRVAAVEPGSYALGASASTGTAPAHVIAAGGKVYVTSAGQGTVDVYRGKGLTTLGSIRLGGMPHGLRASKDGALLAVANMDGRSVDLINAKTGRKSASIPVGGPAVQVAVDTTGAYVYASVSEPASVVKIETRTRKVVRRVTVPSPPVQVYLSDDGKTLVSADQGDERAPGRTASIITTGDMKVKNSVRVGKGPHGVVFDEAAKTAWVTNMYDDTVSVIDLARAKVIATVAVGDAPNGISFSPQSPQSAPTATIPLPMPGAGHGGTGHDEDHDH